MRFDLNKAQNQADYSPIPAGTYRLRTRLRPGGVGENGLLRLAKNLRTMMLDFEFQVIGSPHDGRKIWDLITVAVDEREDPDLLALNAQQRDNYRKAVAIGLARLRAMLESSREIASDDHSDEAKAARVVGSLNEFDGLEFWAKVGIKKGQNGYNDKNTILTILTPDMGDWPAPRKTPPKPMAEFVEDDIPF
jgi:hypothetical protein